MNVLVDAFGRVREVVHEVVDGLNARQLNARVSADANSIAWLIWHLARVQDDHIANVAGRAQAYTAKGWADRFGFPFELGDIGYGHSSRDVGAVRVASGELLTGYYDEVHQHTIEYVEGLTDAELDRVIDDSWDPPVTLGVRLVSVIADDLQHAGQAAFVRGLVQ